MKYILIIIAVLGAIKFYNERPIEVSDLTRSDVTLYATSWCGYCAKTRQFFALNRIPYTEYNIETSAYGKAEYNKIAKGRGVPVIDIKGYVIQGYNEKALRSKLGVN